jgi:inward rectifier potassium channel
LEPIPIATASVLSTSHTFSEVIYEAKFDLMYFENEDNTKTILYLNKLNAYQKVDLT